MSLINNIKDFLSNYKYDKKDKFSHNNSSWGLIKNIKENLNNLIDNEDFKIKPSIGKGNFIKNPSIAILSKQITSTPQEGYYVILLFAENLEDFYLTIHQGFEQYKTKNPTTGKKTLNFKEQKQSIVNNAKKLTKIISNDFCFKQDEVILRNDKSHQYEIGYICSKHYNINDKTLSNEIIKTDLKDFIYLYRKIISVIGNRLMEYDLTISEDDYQKSINDALLNDSLKSDKKELIIKSYPRSQKAAQEALKKAKYKCEVDSSHFSFFKDSENMFLEAHHLIPMEYQDEFNRSLDVPENIISLCPNCHRFIHHGVFEEKIKIIEKLFEKRKIDLWSKNLKLEFDELKKYYT